MTWNETTAKPKPGGHRVAAPHTAQHRQPEARHPRIGDPRTLTYDTLCAYIDFDPDGFDVPGKGMPKPTRQGLRKMQSAAMRLEKLDPKHRMGDALMGLFAWYEMAPGLHTTPFFPWVDARPDDELRKAWIWHSEGRITPAELAVQLEAFKHGVSYMTPDEAEGYRATVAGGLLQWQGQPLNTVGAATAHGGEGAWIWVLDRNNAFYTAPHALGRLHHSSFKAGHAVKAAGEWIVENGRLAVIAGLTGHYRTRPASFVDALHVLFQQSGADVFMARVKFYRPGDKTQTAYVTRYTEFQRCHASMAWQLHPAPKGP